MIRAVSSRLRPERSSHEDRAFVLICDGPDYTTKAIHDPHFTTRPCTDARALVINFTNVLAVVVVT